MQKKSFQTILYSTAGVLVMLVIVIAFNFITGLWRARVDLTHEKAYTLSAGHSRHPEEDRYADRPQALLHPGRSRHARSTVALRDYAEQVEDLLAE